MTTAELLDKISNALALFDGVGIEHQADAAFETLICPSTPPGEFSDDEWSSIVAENDRLWALLKYDKNRKRNAYQVGLLQHAFKMVEARA